MKIPEIAMQAYDYELPHSKIAQQALEPRDSAKLLVYKNNRFNDSIFKEITSFLPADASLFYNDAKVIPARIFLKKESGTTIEIFLLKPYMSDYFTTLNAPSSCQWECLVGNKKKWKDSETITVEIISIAGPVTIQLTWHNRENNIVQLAWQQNSKFIDLLEQMGKMPLPPYIKREAEANDRIRYQTIYSSTQGSVAAPTAGLHFTDNVLQDLKTKSIDMTALTLHVSAGTFLPVSVEKASEHAMHQEIFSFNKILLQQLKNSTYRIAVGTTSVRVLESLFWCAVNISNKKEHPFCIEKLDPYENETNLSADKALDILIDFMDKNNLEHITGATSILIMPGYAFKFIQGLITNFHQPKSTLILLIAAFIGEEDWKAIYAHALENNYRFLSYGDSSLLLK